MLILDESQLPVNSWTRRGEWVQSLVDFLWHWLGFGLVASGMLRPVSSLWTTVLTCQLRIEEVRIRLPQVIEKLWRKRHIIVSLLEYILGKLQPRLKPLLVDEQIDSANWKFIKWNFQRVWYLHRPTDRPPANTFDGHTALCTIDYTYR